MSAQEPARRDKRDGPPLSERQAQRERLRGVDRSKAMLSPVLCPRASGPPDAANVSIGHMLVPCDPKEVHPEHNGAWFCDTCQPGFQGKSPSDMMHRCQFGCAFAMCEGCAADRCFQDGDRVLFSGDSDVSGWDSDGLGGGLMTLSVGAAGVCLNGVPVDALALQELSKVIEPPRHKLRGAANGSQDGWEAELQARVEALQAQTARLEADKITMMQQGAEAVETLRQSKARAAPRPALCPTRLTRLTLPSSSPRSSPSVATVAPCLQAIACVFTGCALGRISIALKRRSCLGYSRKSAGRSQC